MKKGELEQHQGEILGSPGRLKGTKSRAGVDTDIGEVGRDRSHRTW